MRARRAALVILLACGSAAGCVFGGWGTYPLASGDGVEPYGLGSARIRTSDVAATIDVGIYEPNWVFAGIVVPVIPVFWLGWINGVSEHLRVTVQIDQSPDLAAFDSASLRVMIASQGHRANSVRVSQSYVPPATQRIWLQYDFDDVASPYEPFSIVADGLPRIDYEPQRRWLFDVWDEP